MKNDKEKRKPYEDRYRMLSRDIPLVGRSGRGEVFAVMDGIGGAELGMRAAQAIADCLIHFYRKPDSIPASSQGLHQLLFDTNMAINQWGCMPGTDRPLGGAAGTVAWMYDMRLHLFHAGDTAAVLIRDGQPPRVLTKVHEFDGGLSRYFGLGNRLNIDAVSEKLQTGDLLLLVSDGVTKVFSTTEAANLVREVFEKTGDVGKASEELVIRSRAKKSVDDITALLIEVVEE